MQGGMRVWHRAEPERKDAMKINVLQLSLEFGFHANNVETGLFFYIAFGILRSKTDYPAPLSNAQRGAKKKVRSARGYMGSINNDKKPL